MAHYQKNSDFMELLLLLPVNPYRKTTLRVKATTQINQRAKRDFLLYIACASKIHPENYEEW
jgi:hypothetical protein